MAGLKGMKVGATTKLAKSVRERSEMELRPLWGDKKNEMGDGRGAREGKEMKKEFKAGEGRPVAVRQGWCRHTHTAFDAGTKVSVGRRTTNARRMDDEC